jgi:hypothetical protein
MMDFDRSVFRDAFAEAGMWVPIRATSQGSPAVSVDLFVDYRAPDNIRVNGSISDDHEIEYVADDLPDLREGDSIVFLDADGDPIAGRSFRVRAPPFITDNPGDDQSGFFKRALLTRIL